MILVLLGTLLLVIGGLVLVSAVSLYSPAFDRYVMPWLIRATLALAVVELVYIVGAAVFGRWDLLV